MQLQRSLLEISILALLWGPSFLFIKIAVQEIAPLTLVAVRISLAVGLLYSVLKLKAIRLPSDRRLWMHCFMIGIFANGLPFICFNYALMHIPTSLSALINGMTPVLTVLLANLFLVDERLTKERIVGVVLGVAGFIVLFLPALLGQAEQFDLKGVALSGIGASCYAVSIVYARKYVNKTPALVAPMLQLLSSLTYLIPLAFIFENPLPLLHSASVTAWSAVLGLTVLGTLLAYIMYYRILQEYGATSLSMVTYLLPIIGTLLGVIFLKEVLTLSFMIAASLILGGVLVVTGHALPAKQVSPKF